MSSRLRRPAGALLATAVATTVFGIVPAAHAADGSISGVVTGSGGDLEGISVKAWEFEEDSWNYSPHEGSYDSTDATGAYSLSLPPGEYRIGFYDSEGGYIEEFYDDAADVDSADTITLGDGQSVTGRDAVLALASHITGTVIGPDALPVLETDVAALKEFPNGNGETVWGAVAFGLTDADGHYDIGSLPAGTYRVEFGDRLNPNLFASEFYDDQATELTAQDITVGVEDTVEGIDAELALESTIAGTVTGAADEPLAGAGVYVYEFAGGEWAYLDEVTTNGVGQYTLSHLPRGTYRVEFQYETPNGDFLFEAYNNKAFLPEADDVVVAEDVDVTGIDAKLVAGEHDPLPYLEGVTIPMISGTPQVGSTLSVTAGTWEQGEVSATYQWFNDDGAIAGATATTYVPAATDVGKTLVVLVEASKPGFQNRFNMSNTVGPITAAPVVTPPVVTPPVVAPPVVAPPVVTPAPVLSFSKKIDVVGALTVGSTLKLKNFKALVSRTTVTYKIQWYAGSKKIKKATKSKLKVTKALKGKKIFVKVTAISGTTSKTVKVKVGKIR